MADVENKQVDSTSLLVYDVSRWGRFQDVDESAYYEYVLKRAGIRVHLPAFSTRIGVAQRSVLFARAPLCFLQCRSSGLDFMRGSKLANERLRTFPIRRFTTVVI